MNLCKDCKWVRLTLHNSAPTAYYCDSPDDFNVSLVTGKVLEHVNCATRRAPHTGSMNCNYSGRYWEPANSDAESALQGVRTYLEQQGWERIT